MGNTISFITSHGKRLLNRYNAQFRALRFLDKEKLPSAPRHSLPPSLEQDDPVIYEHLHKKDAGLGKFLQDVYIKSYDEEPLITKQNNPLRPLPTYNETPKKETFQEPVEMVKGFCTLSQFFEFRTAHENDPVENSASVIAKNYCLDVKKVENLLKYYSVFNVYEVTEENKSNEDDMNHQDIFKEIRQIKLDIQERLESQEKGKSGKGVKTEKEILQLESQENRTLKSERQGVKN